MEAWRCLLLAGTLALKPVAARAADAVIGFDDLPVGTVVTTQYASQGIVFGTSPIGGGSTQPVVRADANARSPGHVADLGIACGREFCNFVTYGQLATLRNRVRLYLGSYGPGGSSHEVFVRAYDLSGEPLGDFRRATVVGGAGYGTAVELNDPEGDIAFFSIGLGVVAPPAPPIALDDVTLVDPVTPPAPQFRITLQSGFLPVGLVQGETVQLPLVIRRANGSTGALQFTLSGLTPGLAATFSPNPSTGADGSVVTLSLSASRDATVGQGKLTVGVTPTPTAGTAKKHLEVPFYIERFELYDARITGIEVSQGIQTIGAATSLPARNPADPAAPVRYEGVRLAGGRPTVVRVFANLRFGPSEGVLTYCRLRGFANGRELPLSPLNPDAADTLSPGPRTIRPGSFDFVDTAARAKPEGAFTFTLPREGWRGGTITLQAEIQPREGRALAECTDPICGINNTFVLSDVPFTVSGALTVLPIVLRVRGVPDPADPWTVLAATRTVTPYGLLPTLYRGVIDVSDIVFNGDRRSDRSSDVLDEVEDWDDDNGLIGSMTMGVIGGVGGISDLGVSRNAPVFEDRPVSVVNEYRPLGSVAHELLHGFGRRHASAACGAGADGQQAEGWPPDEQGYLQGFGLDPRPGSGGASGPYRVFTAGGCGSDGKCLFAPWRGCTMSAQCEWFDFMAYTSCQPGGGEGSLWVSPRGWNFILERFALRAVSGRDVVSPVAETTTTLRVRGRFTESGFAITGVRRRTGPVPALLAAMRHASAPALSPYRLVVRGASGEVLADEPMLARESHVNEGGGVVSLLGDAPPDGAEQVDLVDGETVVATRRRSPHAPDVSFLGPRRRLPGRGEVRIQWQVVDADGDPTRSAVDFSTDDGVSWRPIFRGATSSPAEATLPRSLFRGTRRGRIRVRATDGFNETAVVSGRLVVPRMPPVVRIESPVAGQTVASDGVLNLVGDAHDDGGNPVPDAQLRWFVGRKRVGRGREVSLVGLRARQTTVRLLARDRGRTGKASVTIQVVAPQR